MDLESLVLEMLETLRAQSAQNHALMTTMVESQRAQAAVMQSWIDLFKPPTTPTPSTSLVDRELSREAELETEWEPVSPEVMQEIFNEFK